MRQFRSLADLGCGPGIYLPFLGRPAVGVDAARAMLDLSRAAAPDVPVAAADLEALPFAREKLGGAWARNSYLHVPAPRLPMALAHLHSFGRARWHLHRRHFLVPARRQSP